MLAETLVRGGFGGVEIRGEFGDIRGRVFEPADRQFDGDPTQREVDGLAAEFLAQVGAGVGEEAEGFPREIEAEGLIDLVAELLAPPRMRSRSFSRSKSLIALLYSLSICFCHSRIPLMFRFASSESL